MGFEQGHRKSGGRKPSTPNKRTLKLIEILEEHGYNPVAELIEWADVAKEEYGRFNDIIERFEQAQQDVVDNGLDSSKMPDISEAHTWARIGVQSALGLLPYVYPKRKPLDGQEEITPEKAQSMTTEELIANAEQILAAFKGAKQ